MHNNMKNLNPKTSLIIGIVLLILSAFMYWKSNKPNISTADQVLCEQQLQQKYNNQADAQLLEMCKTSVGMIAQTKAEASGATSAEEMAKAISQANQGETGGTMFIMFFVGLFLLIGGVLTIRGIQGILAKK